MFDTVLALHKIPSIFFLNKHMQLSKFLVRSILFNVVNNLGNAVLIKQGSCQNIYGKPLS